MALVRPCLDCGRLTRGSRCRACVAARGGLSQRGSTRRWRRLRAAVIRQGRGRCARCRRATDLDVHHEPDGRLTPLCRDCHARAR
jgi:5-methylcytosine-specific restriction endonuclease McrA